MQVLMLGGTRFFGLRLARLLIAQGHELTVVTRGQRAHDLGGRVTQLHADRTDGGALREVLQGQRYDIVYDQICYNPREAKAALQALDDRVGRYVFTSSIAVYDVQEREVAEDAFAPGAYEYDLDAPQYAYDEGKRQAEAYFYRHAPCPVVAARVAMVVSGTDDYTGRFDFHVARVAKGETIGVGAQEHEITYVTAWDAAEFLYFLGVSSDCAGPVNVGNPGYLSAQGISREIGMALGKEPRVAVVDADDPSRSPYAMDGTLRVSTEKAVAIGYAFAPLVPQLPDMTLAAAARLGLA